MAESIREAVRVGVVFGGRPRVRPVWFIWNGRTVRVQAITYAWQTREGRAAVHHFAVTDGANVYELRYDADGQGWTLEAVDAATTIKGTLARQSRNQREPPKTPKTD
jgi:hypothetical protein